MKNKFYVPEDCNNIYIIIGNRKQRYLYHRIKTFITYYEEEIESLKFVNDYKEENYPPRYYMDQGALEVLNVLLEEIKE